MPDRQLREELERLRLFLTWTGAKPGEGDPWCCRCLEYHPLARAHVGEAEQRDRSQQQTDEFKAAMARAEEWRRERAGAEHARFLAALELLLSHAKADEGGTLDAAWVARVAREALQGSQ